MALACDRTFEIGNGEALLRIEPRSLVERDERVGRRGILETAIDAGFLRAFVEAYGVGARAGARNSPGSPDAARTDLLQFPPALLFLFVAAEEQGLLGSEFYATHPSFLPGRIAANLNFDGGNIWGPTRDVTLIGMGKSTLDQVAQQVSTAQGRTLEADQFPDRGFYYRSDQFNFAKIGVPALYFDTGTDFVGRPEGWGEEQIEKWTEVHYHQPSDELEPGWNFVRCCTQERIASTRSSMKASASG